MEGSARVRYATAVGKWEAWMRPYRLGVLLILPPPDVAAQIDALREANDPRSARISPAHISLSACLCREWTDEVARDVGSCLRTQSPLDIAYGPLFPPRPPHPGIALRVEPVDGLRRLRDALHQSVAFEGADFSRNHIPPHMTIAEFLPSMAASSAVRDALGASVPEGTFRCTELSLLVPDEDFRFTPRATVPIGGV